ncbi:MAG TPA: class I SAM-dependent methyltransferase [Acidimicrobiales bacterium]|nr:class I SAM-dependent methyltransferase [Acidimicrobiales bacterium]
MGRLSGRRWRQRGTAPSRTSQTVAMTRAGFVRPHTPTGDADAQRALCSGMRPIRSTPLRAHLAARTQFVDNQVLAAIAGGVDQIVVLGAGYDDRGLRFHSPGVRFFELDHPATQADKRRRVARVAPNPTGLTFAPVDFRVDHPGAVLESAGHDAGRPSLFICEGLLVYLDQATIGSLLAALRNRAADDSTLAASLAIHNPAFASDTVVRIANARRPNGTTEPWRTILPKDSHLDLLQRAGWSPTLAVDDASLGTGAPPQRSLLVTADPG